MELFKSLFGIKKEQKSKENSAPQKPAGEAQKKPAGEAQKKL